jgi:hypothetical protein
MGLLGACSIAAGCGGWVDIDNLPAVKAAAGDGNGVAGTGTATGGSANPTGGRGGVVLVDEPVSDGGDDSGPAPAETACDQGGSTGIAGSIDGAQLHETWEIEGSQWWNRTNHWSDGTQFASNSFEFFMGGDARHLDSPADAPQRVRLGVVRAPASSVVAGQVLCFGDGSLHWTPQLSYAGYSNHARVLGQCPGVPVAGELTLCGSDPNEECAAPISGTLEGTTLSANNLELGMREPTLLDAEADHFKLYGYTDGDPNGSVDPRFPMARAGQIEEGFLMVFPNTPGFAPAVYCVGPNSTFSSFANSNHVETTLRNLSKLGECRSSAGTDPVQFCN